MVIIFQSWNLKWFTLTSVTGAGCDYDDIYYINDGECNDYNNNEACGYDGGDCCGPNVGMHYCDDCECINPDIDFDGIPFWLIQKTTMDKNVYNLWLKYTI